MNARLLTLSLAAIAAVASSQTVEVSKEVQVRQNRIAIKPDTQKTPQFTPTNVKDKRWLPKDWLEVDIAFDAEKANNPADKSPMIESLDFKVFVLLNKRDKDGKLLLLTSNTTYINILEKETQHVLLYASPAGLSRVLENQRPTTVDITPMAVGVEIYRSGALAGWNSTAQGRFWEKIENFNVADGVLLPKNKTPFSTLFGDYDLEAKQ